MFNTRKTLEEKINEYNRLRKVTEVLSEEISNDITRLRTLVDNLTVNSTVKSEETVIEPTTPGFTRKRKMRTPRLVKDLECECGENHPNWKGDKVKKSGVHGWITLTKGRALEHSCFQEDKTCKGSMDWSNISGKYLRDIIDWWVLCKSHHTRFDMTDKWRKNISEGQIKRWKIKKGI